MMTSIKTKRKWLLILGYALVNIQELHYLWNFNSKKSQNFVMYLLFNICDVINYYL